MSQFFKVDPYFQDLVQITRLDREKGFQAGIRCSFGWVRHPSEWRQNSPQDAQGRPNGEGHTESFAEDLNTPVSGSKDQILLEILIGNAL